MESTGSADPIAANDNDPDIDEAVAQFYAQDQRKSDASKLVDHPDNVLISNKARTQTKVQRDKSTADQNPLGKPHNKPTEIEDSSVEVLIFESTGWGTSSLGHAAINIDGTVYSWAPGGMFIEPASRYLQRNNFRDAIGLELKLSKDERRKLLDHEQGFGQHNNYNFLTSNCVDPIESGLERIGYPLGRCLEICKGNENHLVRIWWTLPVGYCRHFF